MKDFHFFEIKILKKCWTINAMFCWKANILSGKASDFARMIYEKVCCVFRGGKMIENEIFLRLKKAFYSSRLVEVPKSYKFLIKM